ncbi:MAG TPA: hypothetical protein VFF95_12190, partial [Candidatus Binatus sp.]|nr:hypothetical protein [Candidatus Binatus sp.]
MSLRRARLHRELARQLPPFLPFPRFGVAFRTADATGTRLVWLTATVAFSSRPSDAAAALAALPRSLRSLRVCRQFTCGMISDVSMRSRYLTAI